MPGPCVKAPDSSPLLHEPEAHLADNGQVLAQCPDRWKERSNRAF